MLVRGLQQKAVQKGRGPALVVLLPRLVAGDGGAQQAPVLAAGEVEVLGQVGHAVRGVRGVEVVAYEALAPLFGQLRHRRGPVLHAAQLRVREVGVEVVAGGLPRPDMLKAGLQQEEVAGLQMIFQPVFPQIHAALAYDVEHILVQPPRKVYPRLAVPDVSRHPQTGQQVRVIGKEHFQSPSRTQTAAQ